MKRPAFQFYPADWRKDEELQSCSIGARGLWLECMCIAHESDPYGHLRINGKPMTIEQIARRTGVDPRECRRLLTELQDAGVLSRADDGAILSRRMVRDEDLRQRRAAGGPAGAEHGIKGKDFGSLGGRGGEFDGPGMLYAAQRQTGGPIKVGVTRHLKQRMSALRAKVGEGIRVLGTYQVSDMRAAEAFALRTFEGRRDGEWIEAEWGEVRAALESGPRPPFEPPPSSSSSSSASTGDSEANASAANGGGNVIALDAAAAEAARKEAVFALGLPLLTASGVTERQARSFLGFLRKHNDDRAIAAAIDRCAKERALQPVEFLQGCLRTGARHNNRQEALEADGDRVVAEWLKGQQA